MARRRSIGVLLDDVADPFQAAVHRAITTAARHRGVQVTTCDGADGFITTRDHPTRRPVVYVDRPGADADTVVTTNAVGTAAAIRHLVAHGHRRIAYLGGLDRDRHLGYVRALGGRTGPVVHDIMGEQDAERAVIGVLRKRPDPPTAIFAGHAPITIGAVRALRRLDRHHTVALAGFGDFPLADLLEPAVTVVSRDPARMGRTAVEALLERLDGYAGPPREIRIPTTLIPRGSGEIPTGSS